MTGVSRTSFRLDQGVAAWEAAPVARGDGGDGNHVEGDVHPDPDARNDGAGSDATGTEGEEALDRILESIWLGRSLRSTLAGEPRADDLTPGMEPGPGTGTGRDPRSANGSIVRTLRALARSGLTHESAAIREIRDASEALLRIAVAGLRTRAVEHLGRIVELAERVEQSSPDGGLSIEQARALDLGRRTAFAILQIDLDARRRRQSSGSSSSQSTIVRGLDPMRDVESESQRLRRRMMQPSSELRWMNDSHARRSERGGTPARHPESAGTSSLREGSDDARHSERRGTCRTPGPRSRHRRARPETRFIIINDTARVAAHESQPRPP